MATKDLKRVSDFIGCPYEGMEEFKVEEIEGQDLEIMGFIMRESTFGPTAHVLCQKGKESFCVRTTSTVVGEQLTQLEDKIPLIGQFKGVKNYHTLV